MNVKNLNFKKTQILGWSIFLIGILSVAFFFVMYDPGYALFIYDRWSVEMPLWVFLIVAIVVHFVFRSLAYMFKIPSVLLNWIRKKRENKGLKYFRQGLFLQLKGEYQQAREAFFMSTKNLKNPLLAYLNAASIANSQHDFVAADFYLKKAKVYPPFDNELFDVIQSEIFFRQAKYSEALQLLEKSRLKNPASPKLLYLSYQIYLIQKNWERLWHLLPQLQKLDYFSKEDKFQLEKLIYEGLLASAVYENQQKLAWIWERVPNQIKKDPLVFSAFLKGMLSFNQHDDAEILLRKYLKNHWNEDLIYLYGLVQSQNPQKQLGFAEQWLNEFKDVPQLLVTLGRLSERNKIYGKARGYYEQAVEVNPHSEYYLLLAKLSEKLGDQQAAINWYQKISLENGLCAAS